jgi:phosphoglycerate transport regulatory protein PgtC
VLFFASQETGGFMKRIGFWLVGFVLYFIATSAVAKEVVIVTSFPKELFETYKKTFEGKHPGITVVINSKQTNAGVTYLRETKAKPEADIFWVSAPDAFQTLESDGLLEKFAPP